MSAGFDALDPVIQHHVVNTLGWPALRPLQEAAIEPVLRGNDALLLAPTAGGKTEAALFPIFTRMSQEQWTGTSVLYICPLKALLNNLLPRVAGYGAWLGRTAALRHGDVGASARRRQVRERPDVLLTTPESIESMLVSTLHDPAEVFAHVRAVIVDEVHAFAGDDRGWHLLAVLERVARLAGRPIQRIGCSATVGNAPELLAWLQGGNTATDVGATVVAPPVSGATAADVGLDYVGSIPNAATVIAALHQGEKRLVFTDSRRVVEQLALELRKRGTETYVSHSSLSLDARRQAEAAFAEARDCVIVSTSTLELGIDVGDLDRMLQLGSPATVASFLQRLGRTGRRAGTSRNALFVEPTAEEFLRACGMLLLWSEGYVEPVTAPAKPLHIVAQQVLGLALQRKTITADDVWNVLVGLGMCSRDELDAIVEHLVATGHLDVDDGLLFVGPEAERRYGRKNFLDLMAVFLAPPEVLLLHGREEIGTVDPMALTAPVEGPRVLALGGRSWRVTSIDWRRKRCFVEPSDMGGASVWSSASAALSPELCNAMRRVLLGATPDGVTLTKRGVERLATLRDDRAEQVDDRARLITADAFRTRWWTWAGLRANARAVAALEEVAPELLDESHAFDNFHVALAPETTQGMVNGAMTRARQQFGDDLSGVTPAVAEDALRGLKFAELLPREMAVKALARR